MQGAGDYTHISNHGEGARIAARDYHEHHARFSPSEPEWDEPPVDTGMVKCPRCKRMHFAYEALECGRCGYPQREMLEREARRERWYAQVLVSVRYMAAFLAYMPITLYGAFHHWGAWALPAGIGAGVLMYVFSKKPCAWVTDRIAEHKGMA